MSLEPSTGYNTPLAVPRDKTLSQPSSLESVTSVEYNGFYSFPDPEGEQLREACVGLESILTAKTEVKWAHLVVSHDGECLATSREAQGALLDEPSTPGTIDSELHHHVAIVEELLAERLEFPFSDVIQMTMSHYDQIVHLKRQLLTCFDQRMADAEMNCDFRSAHAWSRQLHSFKTLVMEKCAFYIIPTILECIERPALVTSRESVILTEGCDRWLRMAKPVRDSQKENLLHVTTALDLLRDKMHFVADIRTSAAYHELKSITTALRTMAKPVPQPRNASRTTTVPSLRRRGRSEYSNLNLHRNSEAQNLDLLSVPPSHGGPNKLSDAQSASLSDWMHKNNIENFCQGEERLHKLCQEFRTCIEAVTSNDTAFMRSSNILFAHERSQPSANPVRLSSSSLPPLRECAQVTSKLTLRANSTPSIETISSRSHPLSNSSSRDYLDFQSSVPFWSPAMTEDISPSSITSVGSCRPQATPGPARQTRRESSNKLRPEKNEKLDRRLAALLLSDLNLMLFSEGSETDKAFWTGLGGELSERYLRDKYSNPGNSRDARTEMNIRGTFDFDRAFGRMLQSFSASSDPATKLDLLHDIDELLSDCADGQHNLPSVKGPNGAMSSLQTNFPLNGSLLYQVDTRVEGFRKLFINSNMRPPTIFRDLQYIAALIPSDILETTPQGKAFFNAAAAILGIKQELISNMVETAYNIIEYRSYREPERQRGSKPQEERDSATFQPPGSMPSAAADIARFSMGDAAALYEITAKEGNAVAQRELATMYLSNPELLDRIIAPLARPSEVFLEQTVSVWQKKNQNADRSHPLTMCVASHWINLAIKGGDMLAPKMKRQVDEFCALP